VLGKSLAIPMYYMHPPQYIRSKEEEEEEEEVVVVIYRETDFRQKIPSTCRNAGMHR
jgi:hypothetical protein